MRIYDLLPAPLTKISDVLSMLGHNHNTVPNLKEMDRMVVLKR